MTYINLYKKIVLSDIKLNIRIISKYKLINVNIRMNYLKIL